MTPLTAAKMPAMSAELFGAEMRAAVGDLAKKDREKVGRLVDRSHERVDEAVELASRGGVVGAHRVADASAMGAKTSRMMQV